MGTQYRFIGIGYRRRKNSYIRKTLVRINEKELRGKERKEARGISLSD